MILITNRNYFLNQSICYAILSEVFWLLAEQLDPTLSPERLRCNSYANRTVTTVSVTSLCNEL
jgi:hypothetical protein